MSLYSPEHETNLGNFRDDPWIIIVSVNTYVDGSLQFTNAGRLHGLHMVLSQKPTEIFVFGHAFTD